MIDENKVLIFMDNETILLDSEFNELHRSPYERIHECISGLITCQPTNSSDFVISAVLSHLITDSQKHIKSHKVSPTLDYKGFWLVTCTLKMTDEGLNLGAIP